MSPLQILALFEGVVILGLSIALALRVRKCREMEKAQRWLLRLQRGLDG
jgi:hypothetical protein